MESTEGLLAGPLEGLPTEPQLNTQDADALYAQWLQNFRDENDTDPDWANWSDDDDFLLGRNYF